MEQKFEYSNNGESIVKVVRAGEEQKIDLKVFDKTGKLVEQNSYVEGHTFYKYDKSNNIIEMKTINRIGEAQITKVKMPISQFGNQLLQGNYLDSWLEETFQLDKPLIKCGESKEIQGAQVSKLKCDTKSNWIKIIIKENEETTSINREISYY